MVYSQNDQFDTVLVVLAVLVVQGMSVDGVWGRGDHL